jgi:para-nitrobenzyl esterase
MQRDLFHDMVFRSPGMSEDCLYLNVWTPARSAGEKLPVFLYYYGGGFAAGDGSEDRYDGASMAAKGIVTITANYRLSVLGFFAYSELTAESPHHASGNYGLLDQSAALAWVRRNIAAFGGDPNRITIGGESAGSISVCAQMASPLSRGLIAGAIGESGSILGQPLAAKPLAQAEADGVRFAASLGLGPKPSLAALRAVPAAKLIEATAAKSYGWPVPTIDGWFFLKDPVAIYAAGEQAHVPLLAGVNSAEGSYNGILHDQKPTVENYRAALDKRFGPKAADVFKVYPATNESEVMDAAQDLSSDSFISHSTWNWVNAATNTGSHPTFYYLFTRCRPAMEPAIKYPSTLPRGAVHASEIEYALGNLPLNKVYAWTADDRKVSGTMQDYFANFIKTGNPNAPDLPEWPLFSSGQRLVIDLAPHPESVSLLRERYTVLDSIPAPAKP